MEERRVLNYHRPPQQWDGIDPDGNPVCSYRCMNAKYRSVSSIPPGTHCLIHRRSSLVLLTLEMYETRYGLEVLEEHVRRDPLPREPTYVLRGSGLHAVVWKRDQYGNRLDYTVIACERAM